MTLLHDVVATSVAVGATRSRTAKTAALAALIGSADAAEVGVLVAYVSGSLPQRRTGVGYRSLTRMPPAAAAPSLTIAEVDAALEVIAGAAGSGSAGVRSAALSGLLGRATAEEQSFLRDLLTGNLRQGALDGVVLAAVAGAFDVPEESVRRATMLTGSLLVTASLAATGGRAALDAEGLVVGRPVHPMLAASAPDPASACADLRGSADQGVGDRDDALAGALIVDGKLDGIRVQLHRLGGEVRVWTRTLDDITERVPEVVAAVAALPGGDLVLDGEAIVLRPDGLPAPFQVTGARTASRVDLARLQREAPLTTFLFDILHVDGETLLDRPLRERHTRLVELAPHLIVPREVTSSAERVAEFFGELVAAGHEGIVVKDADGAYAAGRRGRGWIKVKPVHTLDLVVLAVERGSGRRSRWLSNIHLGARDPGKGEFVMVGKTFKGMTDAMLQWQTERFTELAVGPTDGWVVPVRPEQVVEIALDGIQRSTRYPGGVALRFARVLRYRDDKSAAEADTLDSVRALGG